MKLFLYRIWHQIVPYRRYEVWYIKIFDDFNTSFLKANLQLYKGIRIYRASNLIVRSNIGSIAKCNDRTHMIYLVMNTNNKAHKEKVQKKVKNS